MKMKRADRSMNLPKARVVGFVVLIVATILLASAGLINLSGLKMGDIGNINQAGGFTINSMTMTKPISNDADLASANLLITATANGGGQSVSGTFDSSTIKSWTGYDVRIPISLEISGISERLEYPIRNEGSIYEYWTVFSPETSNPLSDTCLAGYDYCFKTSKMSLEWYGFVPKFRSINVKKTPVGSYGRFDNPNILWSGVITTTVAGIPYTKNIGSTEGSVDFYAGSEWVAKATWSGSLVTGQATPNPTLYTAVYSGSGTGNTWKVAPSKYFTDYTSSLSQSDTLLETWRTTAPKCGDYECTAVTGMANNHLAVIDALRAQNALITYTSATGESLSQTTGTVSGNPAIIEITNRRISSPQITILTKASKLGIVIPTGMVGELSATATPFSSGDANGVVTVTFKNIGTGTGTFAATFTEPTGTFTQTSNVESAKTTVLAGDRGTITMYIGHGSFAEATMKTATVKVYDINKPSNFEVVTVSVSMTAPKSCVPGTTRASGKIIYTCKPDGTGEIITLDCTGKGAPVYRDGKYACGTSSGTGTDDKGSTLNPDGSINAAKPNWYDTTPAKVLAGLIVFLVILLVWRKQNE